MLELDLKAQIQNLVTAQNFTEARNLSTRLCEQSPNDAEAYFLHGTVCGQLGDYAASEQALLSAYSQAPNHPQLNYNLAVALFEQKKFDQAIEYGTRVVQIEPGNFQAWLYLGQICESAGKPEYAEKSYMEAIKLQPMADDAMRKIGSLYLANKQWQLAAEVFNKLLELGHSDEVVINNIGIALTRAYQYDKLISVLEPLALEQPNNAALNYCIATAYMELGEIEPAERYYGRVLSERPEHVESIASLAMIYKFRGELELSIETISPLVISQPDNSVIAQVFAAIAPDCDRVEDAIHFILNLLGGKEIPDVTEAKILVALGSLYEKQGDFKKGFKYIQKGNKAYSPDFDRENHIKSIELLEQLYSSENVELLPLSGSTDNMPIFILGMPRSGTSLVEQILASHSEVFGAGELKYIQNYMFELNAQQINNKSYPNCVTDVSQSELLRLSEDYLAKLDDLSDGSPRVTDKMPTNFQHLGLIYQLFPNAKVLHCVRDPMDTCVSCYSKFFSGAHTYSYDLADLGFYYRSYVRLMRLWKENLPLKILDVNYEELVNNQEKTIKQILEYCDLKWDPGCMDFHKTTRTVATASTNQVRKPMYTSSIGKWRRYEKHVKPLIDALEKYK